MTADRMARLGTENGLAVVAQMFRNDHDCISVFCRT